jgi:transcriptional regulator of nitric oxide reductase
LEDQGLDFDATDAVGALLAPVAVPGRAAASARHRVDAPFCYTTDGLHKLFQSSIKRLKLDHTVDKAFSLADLHALSKASPHAMRHTFGTLAVADGMPIDVAQAVLGHKTARPVQSMCKRRPSVSLRKERNISQKHQQSAPKDFSIPRLKTCKIFYV